MNPVIPNKVPANRTHKHSEVADDVTYDGGKLTPTLNATIVEIAAVDRFFVVVVARNIVCLLEDACMIFIYQQRL